MNKNLITVGGVFVMGLAIGRYSLPAKIVQTEKIQYVDRVVEKRVEVTTVTKKDNKIYIRVETIKPDGTRTIETKIIDKDQTLVIDNTTSDKKRDTSTVTENSAVTTYSKQNLLITVGIESSTGYFPSFGYTAGLQKRVLGPFYLGGSASTDKSVGLNLGLAF